MRTIEDTRTRWDSLFRNGESTADLRRALKSDQEGSPCIDGLRSICWKAFLLFGDLDRTQWLQTMADSRSAYSALREHLLKYIDHPDDLQSTIDPLADDEESPWQTLRRDENMRAEISQDIERCLQENSFFREPTTKAKMLNVLFIYAKLNPDLGYRQGMHEILAPILWVVDRDTVDKSSLGDGLGEQNGDVLQLLDPDYIEHDSFTLFCTVMQTLRVYYEHKEQRSISGQVGVSPIVSRCQNLQTSMLAATDPDLSNHLQAVDILPQIFLTRWIRLLFGREFPFDDVLVVWDHLFAEGLRTDLVEFFCVAMLLRIRWQLLEADYSTALSTLLRYPSPDPEHPQTFVYDGLYLEQNPTVERGRFIISKYTGKPPDSPNSTKSSQGNTTRQKPSRRVSQIRSSDLRDSSENRSPSSRSSARSSPKSLETLFQDVSEGIQRRTETWGVAKVVRGAVSEARRNIQTIQSEARLPRGIIAVDPLVGSTSVPTHNSPVVRRDLAQIAELQLKLDRQEQRSKQLAETLGHALDQLRSQSDKIEELDPAIHSAVTAALRTLKSVKTCLETGRDAPANTEDAPPITVESPRSEVEQPDQTANRSSPSPSSPPPPPPPSSSSSTDLEGNIARPRPSQLPPPPPLLGAGLVNPTPSRPGLRPSLADSDFSWMVDSRRNISSFVSPASVLPEQTRHGDSHKAKQNPLFGAGGTQEDLDQGSVDDLRLYSLQK
ncbi:hypothetical protein ASPZODRAFT_163178 [Penicilliopsis zonata CBS 506.65]|uniref:Rab-GAP TBC domain-containing protein n=1 Tax=Penicilliopsis zonata CBS 506.65 TaxID=1073090 RepID=A0A1L9SW47_9EURO|nr:hypothetical protein ASPZODRAFT_163178 [Penicilliopsis zonata CBS 506.65]OJJ51327.1 hypothetical protein ASPZODRAFT_163178 [Penicilliopsis zonata CBS 506.65]